MSDVMVRETSKVKYRRPLNSQQIKTLHLLYWFRFCTSKQLARSLKKANHKTIQNKLQILEDQGLIGKRYDKSYRLAGKPAEYFITPNGARQLEKDSPGTTNDQASKRLYKNKTVSSGFLKHCIAVTDTAQQLRSVYADNNKLQLLTKSYIDQCSYYPKWKPDLHLKILGRGEAPARHCFVDVWDSSRPFFVSVRKTRNYVSFKDSDDWQEDEGFPAILAICEDQYTQVKLNRQMKRILDEQWDDELIFATTTIPKLQQATKSSDKIWGKVSSDEVELMTLKDLFI